MVRKARHGVMEFLLINHPLDCPICDQGGECDLQDQAFTYGCGHGRFQENKRAVPDHDYGPLISTTMTRCIQCTRCVRFAAQVAGTPVLGGLGRGEHLEIGTYVHQTINSELSGNLIDVCPVGALTSKPYAFRARSWELKKTESIDVLDAQGCNIRIDARGGEVLRVMPRVNEEVNEEWLGDKSRFACDGLTRNRLDTPYVRKNGKLVACDWNEAFVAIATRLKGLEGKKIAAIAGDLADAEAMVALKDLLAGLGSPNLDCRQDGAKIDPSSRAGYLFNPTIAGIEQADVVLLIGTNPRKEAPVLNSRIRKRYLNGKFAAGYIGPKIDLTYKAEHLGDGTAVLAEIVSGKHPFAARMKTANKPLIIIGQGALRRADGAAVLALARKAAEACGAVKDGWNGFAMLHTAASRVGGLDLGLVPGAGGRDVAGILDGASKGDVEFVYLLGADEIDTAKLGKAFVVYQGHHGDAGAARADVILPGAAYTEKSGTYVNTEGRVQRTQVAVFPPGEAKEDWKILRALSEVLGKTLPYNTLAEIRARLVAVNPSFAKLEQVTPAAWGSFGTEGATDSAALAYAIENYYTTDPISRVSPTLGACVAAFMTGQPTRTGTHG
jgi:NADH-quinone oxidoreductase subunit G